MREYTAKVQTITGQYKPIHIMADSLNQAFAIARRVRATPEGEVIARVVEVWFA